MGRSEFKANLVYKESSRTARAVTEKPCLKKKNGKKKLIKSRVMVAHTFNPSTGEAETGL